MVQEPRELDEVVRCGRAADSVADVRARCRWSTSTLYDVNAPGLNHGLLLGRSAGRRDRLHEPPR